MRQYDPAGYPLIIAGNIITEFFDDTFITVEKLEDDFTPHVGAGGDVALARSHNEMVQIDFVLQQTSPSNDVLSALLATHKATGIPPGAAMLRDVTGTTVVSGSSCWLTKPPNIELGTEVSSRTWRLMMPKGRMNVGGSPLAV